MTQRTSHPDETQTVAPSLKALLNGLIDYAGIFPPASLSLNDSCKNFDTYADSKFSWMLHWLVLNAEQAKAAPAALNSVLSIVSDHDSERAAALETKSVIQAPKPVYCEVAPGNTASLDEIKAAGCFAKIRTGGVVPEAIPAPEVVARFILDCAQRKLAFKATAGLHHPIRANHPLTYAKDAPHAVMHGFINILMASAFAWNGETDIEPIIADLSPQNFKFDETHATWKTKSLTVAQVEDARKNFIHSIGSCSFDEPVHDLQALGLLPKV